MKILDLSMVVLCRFRMRNSIWFVLISLISFGCCQIFSSRCDNGGALEATRNCLHDIEVCFDGIPHTPSSDSQIAKVILEPDGKWKDGGSSQYMVSPEMLDWKKSQTYCKRFGGDLAYRGVRSWEKRKSIEIESTDSKQVWIGISVHGPERNWKWINKEEANYSDIYWNVGEPSNSSGIESCATMWIKTHKSNDVSCKSPLYGLCEKKKVE